MKFVSFKPEAGAAYRPGVIRDGTLIDLTSPASDPDWDTSGLDGVLYRYTSNPDDVSAVIEAAIDYGSTYDRNNVDIGPPVAEDARMIALGGAFASHLRIRGSSLNKVPSQWIVPETSVVGPNDAIVLDERVVEDTRPAVELGVVVGKSGTDIPESEAYDHVAGFTIVNDVTARTEWPGPMAYKLMDTFSPCGPHIVTADRIEDPHDLAVAIRQDDETICVGRTAGLRFTISFMISYLSSVIPLRPGDIISTGDPGDIQSPLRPGGTVELEIEDVGTLVNPVERANENK